MRLCSENQQNSLKNGFKNYDNHKNRMIKSYCIIF